MSDEYTPDEAEIRTAIQDSRRGGWDSSSIPGRNGDAEGLRGIAKLKADVWDEGYRAGLRDMSDLRAGRLTFQTITSNPYWNGTGQ